MAAGAAIGLNRVMNGKPAGVRVNALVSLACAILVLAAERMGGDASVARVVQGILGGIGFLGAGMILRDQTADNPRRIYHLTTATSVWSSAALGVACGVGAWAVALVGVIGVLIVLAGAIRLDRAMYEWWGDEDDRGDPIA